MENAKITPRQLFFLLVLFEFGTALSVGLGVNAKKDAWIAVLLGMIAGLLLILVYGGLYRIFPTLVLTASLRKTFGKIIGWPIGLIYLVYFLYGAARDLRDAGELLVTSTFDVTPMVVIITVMIVTISYVLAKGVEVLGRTAEIYLLVLFVLGLIGNLLVMFSGIINLHNLRPIMENGFQPVWETTFPLMVVFPFGEVICFTMLLPYLNKPQAYFKTGLYAILLSGLILTYTTALNIAVLGANIASRATFPLFTTISRVDIADFIQRLDAIVILTLIIGDFFKIAIFYYAGMMAAVDLFKFKGYRRLVVPFGFLILFLSMMIASSFQEHILEGWKVNPMYLSFPLQVVVPVLLLLIAWLRFRLFKKKGQNQRNQQDQQQQHDQDDLRSGG